MQATVEHGMGRQACSGCGSPDGIASSVHEYRGPYFCIRCCNYLDESGRLLG